MGLRARLRDLVATRAAESRMNEEFRFHVDMEAAKNVRAGMTPNAARRAAGLDAYRLKRTFFQPLLRNRLVAGRKCPCGKTKQRYAKCFHGPYGVVVWHPGSAQSFSA